MLPVLSDRSTEAFPSSGLPPVGYHLYFSPHTGTLDQVSILGTCQVGSRHPAALEHGLALGVSVGLIFPTLVPASTAAGAMEEREKGLPKI